MPGINDSPQQVERLIELAEEAGATSIGGIALHLRKGVREVFMAWLETARPDLVPRYREMYRRGAYAPAEERRRIARMVRRGGAGPGSFRSMGDRFRDGDSDEALVEYGHPSGAHAAPRQQTLF
jgi:DNA repair photolyase